MPRVSASTPTLARPVQARRGTSYTQAPSLSQARRGRVLRQGQQGASVAELQKKLGIKPDGKFGPKTRQAVVRAQEITDSTVDGLVGPETLSVLDRLSTRAKARPAARDSIETSPQRGKRSRQAKLTGRRPPATASTAAAKSTGPRGAAGLLIARPAGNKLATTVTPDIKRDDGALFNAGQKMSKTAKPATSAAGLGLKIADAFVKSKTGQTLGKTGKAGGAVLGFAGHFLGDAPVAKTAQGHAAASALKTVGDTLAKAIKTGGTAAGLLAKADSFVPVDNPAKLATATAAELVPASQVKKAISGGVDAATALVNLAQGKNATAYKQAEKVEKNTINGKYGAPAQALGMAVGLATDPKKTAQTITDNKAARGERGIFAAWGNAAGDAWAEVNNKGAHKPSIKVYKSIDALRAEQNKRKWYKPWTW